MKQVLILVAKQSKAGKTYYNVFKRTGDDQIRECRNLVAFHSKKTPANIVINDTAETLA